jgi:hypothetical protein
MCNRLAIALFPNPEPSMPSVLILLTYTPQGFMQVLCRTMGEEIVGELVS